MMLDIHIYIYIDIDIYICMCTYICLSCRIVKHVFHIYTAHNQTIDKMYNFEQA